jgi:hypothetical protein
MPGLEPKASPKQLKQQPAKQKTKTMVIILALLTPWQVHLGICCHYQQHIHLCNNGT